MPGHFSSYFSVVAGYWSIKTNSKGHIKLTNTDNYVFNESVFHNIFVTILCYYYFCSLLEYLGQSIIITLSWSFKNYFESSSDYLPPTTGWFWSPKLHSNDRKSTLAPFQCWSSSAALSVVSSGRRPMVSAVCQTILSTLTTLKIIGRCYKWHYPEKRLNYVVLAVNDDGKHNFAQN